jgi:hypothetical protein
MSRTRFWTILLGNEPTSFRAPDKDALIPTLKQLQRHNPEAVIKWYERGQLFGSPEEAEAAVSPERPRRPRDWRPGGEHRDPRAAFKITRDEKRRRFKQRQWRDRQDAAPPANRPPGRDEERPSGDRPPRREDTFRVRSGQEPPAGKSGGAGQPRGFRQGEGGYRPAPKREGGGGPGGGASWKPPSSRPGSGPQTSSRDRPWRETKPGGDRPGGGPRGDRSPAGDRNERRARSSGPSNAAGHNKRPPGGPPRSSGRPPDRPKKPRNR